VVLPICYPREDDDVTRDTLVEIAELLGVTKQRAHQIAEQKGFPAPLAEDARGRVWSRYEVQAWASAGGRRSPGREDRDAEAADASESNSHAPGLAASFASSHCGGVIYEKDRLSPMRLDRSPSQG
jgi:hypothetical protein